MSEWVSEGFLIGFRPQTLNPIAWLTWYHEVKIIILPNLRSAVHSSFCSFYYKAYTKVNFLFVLFIRILLVKGRFEITNIRKSSIRSVFGPITGDVILVCFRVKFSATSLLHLLSLIQHGSQCTLFLASSRRSVSWSTARKTGRFFLFFHALFFALSPN